MKKFVWFAILFLVSFPALGSENLVHRGATDPIEFISGLELPASNVLEPESEKDSGNLTQVFVILSGRFSKKTWSLLWGTLVVVPGSEGDFQIKVPIHEAITRVNLVAVGPRGDVQDQNIEIEFPTIEEYLRNEASPRDLKPTHFSVAVGVSSLDYSETHLPDFSEFALTVKVAAFYALLPPRWDLGANIFFTAFPLSSSRSDVSVRYLGANLRVGYALWTDEPWRFSLMAGGYYSTMFVTNGAFGYGSLIYPELYPTLRRSFGSGDAANAYLKFVPINFSLSQHELAVGASWSHALRNRHPVSASLDLSELQFLFSNQAVSRTTSVSLGLGYGF